MRKPLLISLMLFLFLFTSLAQPVGRQFREVKLKNESVEITVSDGRYLIAPCTDNVIHTRFFPAELEVKDFSFALAGKKPMVNSFHLLEEGNNITLTSGGMQVRITKQPFSVSYYFRDKLLIAEKAGFVLDSLQKLNFSIGPNEVLYGGGARVLGMNHRGQRLMLYNRAHYGYETHSELMNYTLPLFYSSRLYGVLFDNASLGWLDLDSRQNNEVSYETIGGIPDYYVIAGSDWFDLVKQYTLLTGRQPMLPRWALGNFSSRFGYHSQAETENTVKQFAKENIPLDAVVIDIYWFGKDIQGSMGNLDWYSDSFPRPQKMMKRFAKNNIKTILVTEPFVLTTSDRWKEAVDKGVLATDSAGKPYTYDFYFGNTGLVDIFKPEAKEWFWDIYKDLVKQGVDGWWGDLGEPEVHPSDLQHISGSADELHNAYGHEWAKMIFEGYRRDFPDTRPFILMRAGYAGSQRYGMIPWSGDVSRSWGGLVPQPEIALQMGMQGLAYMHSDLGGFAGGDTIDNELYTRWLQYGVFQPVFRPHAQEHIPAEPVFQKQTTRLLAQKAIELRYALLPYNYNLVFKNNQSGAPLMIPLFFIEQDNPELLTYDSAYMWGNSFLVSPIKAPGLANQPVYFPKGSQWTDFFSGEQFEGGKTKMIALKPDHIPVFVKGGSFIPMAKPVQNTAAYSLDNFEMHYYRDTTVQQSSYTLYNDDGKTFGAYTKGQYEMMDFTADASDSLLVVSMIKSKGLPRFLHENYKLELIIHHLSQKPKAVLLNGELYDHWRWDNIHDLLIVDMNLSAKGSKVEVRLD
ncbi:MAG: glycoside hydrolase family 31 protein [Lentimicrobium sp.]|nr:glycoside hydrolase family 31 protein [Lentimicrobium sp.]